MKIRRSLFCIFSIALAGMILFLLMAFLRSQVAEAQSLDPIQPAATTQYSGEPFIVSPDPPQAHEPTDLRVILFNASDSELVRYAQFYWSGFGIGQERHPIEGRIPFVIPPHAEGTTFVVWIPPDVGQYCFYVDIYDTPGAMTPIAVFQHNVTFLGHPDPNVPLYTQNVPVSVQNRLTAPATFVLTVTVPVSATTWEAVIEPHRAVLLPGEIIIAQAMFTYTGSGQLPPGGLEIFPIQATADGRPVGGAEIVFGPPLRLHLHPEPPFAESEISVTPYPIPPGEPTEICVEVRNVTHQPREAWVFFRAAPFGIGFPFEQVAPPVSVFIPELGIQQPCVHWVAPQGGQYAFEVLVETPGFPMSVRSQRVMDVSELLLPGTTSILHFPVHNFLGGPVTLSMALHPFRTDWEIRVVPDVLTGMAPYETRLVTLTVTIPPGSPMPLDEAPVVDVEAFAGPELIGGFRKIYRPPLPIHPPGDPIYAEGEIKVRPYPPQEREPTEICVEVRNPTTADQVMSVDFRWAEFGIGLPWHLIRSTEQISVPAGGMVFPCTMWIPPHGGRFGFEVGIQATGHDRIYSQRVIDVGEILLPNQPEPFEFLVGNPYNFPITVTLGAIRYLPQWEVTFDPQVLHLPPGAVNPVTMIVVPVQRPGDPKPHEGDPVIDVEAYWEGNQLLGGFRKLFFPPVPIHYPEDPPYAEREINILPYPPLAGEPTLLTFEARNPTAATQQITVTFEVGNFGIGLPFYQVAVRNISLPPLHTGLAEAYWVPPFAGEFCVRLRVEAPFFAEPFYSTRNVSIVRLPLPYGTPEVFPFVIGDNGIFTRPLTVTLGLKKYLPNWQVALGLNEIVFAPGQTIATAVLTITPPTDPRNLPRDGGPIADISAYVNGELIGGIRKVWRSPVPLGQLGEPSYAESEIVINPDPPVAGHPTTFAAQVRNNSDFYQTITVQFGWANFGFGIPFTTTHVTPTQTVITLAPHLTTTVSAQWMPVRSGDFCIQIILTNQRTQEELLSRRNVHVVEVPETPCEPFVKDFWLQNATPYSVTVTIGASAINLPPGWSYSATPTQTVLAPYTGITVTVVVTPPCDLIAQVILPPLGSLDTSGDGSSPKIQVEGYDQDGELIGGVELQLVPAMTRIYMPLVMENRGVSNLSASLPVVVPTTAVRLPNWWIEKPLWVAILLLGGVVLYQRWKRDL